MYPFKVGVEHKADRFVLLKKDEEIIGPEIWEDSFNMKELYEIIQIEMGDIDKVSFKGIDSKE